MPYRFTIVGLGEALFDMFPDRRTLGGAPLNVAVIAHQLIGPRGGRAVVVSRVGQDELGQALLEELRQREMTTDFIQTDPDRATGRVYIDLDEQGQPSYEIVRDAAWDVLQFDPDLEDLAQSCDAVCFGSLAQRDAQARNTIYRFLNACPRAIRMFDVNLRQSFYDQGIIRRSCELASVVKLNQQELPIVSKLLGVSAEGEGDTIDRQARAILRQCELDMVVLTRAADGTRIYSQSGEHDGEAVSYPPAADADGVGAGDASAAGILVGKVLRMPLPKVATLANHLGAYVNSQPGATPALPKAILAMTGGTAA